MDKPFGVSIGQAATLYGLAPSTLRWWESQGVLPEPPRVNGRRVYTETDLRRIGLAYLCCITGAMPLDQAAVVTSDRQNRDWQDTVKHHADAIEEKIRQLRSAHEYLQHLRQCPDNDIVRNCPHLDGELRVHTPRGRVAAKSLVAAAQSVPTRGATADARDEMQSPRDENGSVPGRCAVCARPFTRSGRGRRRRYCSRACQQQQYRRRARP